MGSVTREDAISFANGLAAKCLMPQRVETVQEINSDFVLLVYYAVMGELPKDIYTESKSRGAQIHNIDCIVNILASDYLQTNLSHISSKKFVQGDPTNIFNLLEILDGLLEFMLEYVDDKPQDNEEDVPSASTSGDDLKSYQNYLNGVGVTTDYSSVIFKEKLPESDDELSFHQLKPTNSPTNSELSSNSGHAKKLVRSLKDISISSVEGELKPPRSLPGRSNFTDVEPKYVSAQNDLMPRVDIHVPPCPPARKYEKIPAKKNLISRFESLALDDTFKIDKTRDESDNDRRKYSWKYSKETDEYSSSSGGIDVCDGGDDDENKTEDKNNENKEVETTTLQNVVEPVPVETIPKTVDDKTEESKEITEGETEMEETGSKDDVIDKPETKNVVPDLSMSGRDVYTKDIQPKKDWQTLMDNLQQTVEESRRIREKYYSSPLAKSNAGSSKAETSKSENASSSSSNDGSIVGTYPSAVPRHKGLKVRFDENIDISSPAVDFNDDASVEREFEDVLHRERQLQEIKNKMLECSYMNHLEDVNAAESKKLKPLRQKAAKTEDKLRTTIAKERHMIKQKRSRDSHLANVRRSIAQSANKKGCVVPIVRNVPQRRVGGPVKKKIKPNLAIGEHDLLPTLLSEFPGLELSKPILDNAWRKQFRQIENLTKMEASHLAKKRASDLKLQEAHQCHQLLTDIMRRDHDHTQRVREARARENSKRSAEIRVKERRQQTARICRYYSDYQLQMRSKMMRRRTREEKIFKHLFEEGLEIQKSRLRELRKYAKDKRERLQNHQRNQIASLENYYRDQFEVLAESLKQEKQDLNVRDKAQTQLVRQMKSGLRKKMEQEIEDLQELIMRDDDDAHFREIEADRVRRQLQLATYHARFKPDILKP